jgi:hypothetical protein
VGYIPKRRCPECATSFGKKHAESQVCYQCNAQIGVTSPRYAESRYNQWLTKAMDEKKTIRAGLDNITQSQQVESSTMGCALWIRVEE